MTTVTTLTQQLCPQLYHLCHWSMQTLTPHPRSTSCAAGVPGGQPRGPGGQGEGPPAGRRQQALHWSPGPQG